MREAPVTEVKFRHNGRDMIVSGREAWALDQLLTAGQRGVTPITHVGPRWSEYIRRLRGRGIDIETIHEGHRGAFAGRHGRYLLKSTIEVLATKTSVEVA